MEATTKWKRIAAEVAPFIVLWALYFAFGLWLRRQIPLEEIPGELHGFDYNAHGLLFSDYRLIHFTRFRHPLFGWLMSPIPLLLGRIAQLSFSAYWVFLSLIFSAIVTMCVWLVFRIAARIEGVGRLRAMACAGVFACFGYMRYLAAGPESFPVSMLLALLVLWWGAFPPNTLERRLGENVWRKIDFTAWGALLFLSGGITITQGVKTVLAYIVSRRVTKRMWIGIAAGAAALAVVGTVFYVVKLEVLNAGGRNIAGGFEELLSSIPHGLSWTDRLRMLEMFFCEPILPHGVPYAVSEITGGYTSWWPYAVCAAVYLMAGIGAWRMRRTRLVRILFATFAIDALIHLVFFWGMTEAQIYCGHWFYALPILMAGAFTRQRSEASG